MSDALSMIESELRRRGVASARELAASLKVSQPTVSRALSSIGAHRLIRLGQGRATHYALARRIGEIGERWPLYLLDEGGQAQRVGHLVALESRQWCLLQEEPWDSLVGGQFNLGLYPDLPWFLDDLRPQGFLGRAFARRYGHELGASANPRDWSSDAVVLALLRYGHDLQGAFVLGDAMLSVVQGRLVAGVTGIPETRCSALYPERAEGMLAGEWPGSSAAGEQPKFTAVVEGEDGAIRHVIVKFSGGRGRPEDRRWADLLAAEHAASGLLQEHGVAAAQTRLIDAGGRRFLESIRFDRIGAHGRRGLVSLAVLDAAFFGQMETPWAAAAERLLNEGWLTDQDAERLALQWWFGGLIGNTDMHYGNASLFIGVQRPLALAPCYDMLPMLYRPGPEGDMPDRLFQPPTPLPHAMGLWRRAAEMAELFWDRLSRDPAVSDGFRRIASDNAVQVVRYRHQFGAVGGR